MVDLTGYVLDLVRDLFVLSLPERKSEGLIDTIINQMLCVCAHITIPALI